MTKETITIFDYASRAAQVKGKIILNFFLICTIAVMISLIVPKTYTASSTILPSSDTSDMMGLSSLLSDLPSSIGGIGGISTLSSEGATMMAILNSRTMSDAVISEFDLMNLYKTPTMVETRKALAKMVTIEPTEEGTIAISCRAKTKSFSFGDLDDAAKRLSCNMANFIILQLDKINKELRTEKGKSNREFIEKRVLQNKADLVKAENEYNNFQKMHGVVAMEEQTKASIEVIAQLKALITSKEVELGYKSSYYSETNNEIEQARKELQAMKQKYDQLSNSTGGQKTAPFDVFLPMNTVPDLGMEYARLYRELMIQEKIMEFLVPMYEQAKIQEAKDTPSLQLIDKAVLPDKKTTPKRALIVLFAGFVSLLFSFLSIYISVNLEYIRNTDSEKHAKLSGLFRDFISIKRRHDSSHH
jgi:tyrosine-protein kinase Etk/Wzc